MPRRLRRRIAACCGVLALLGACRPPTPPFRAELLVFGGPASVEFRGVAGSRAEAVLAELAALFATLGHDWHPWQPGALVDLNTALSAGMASRPPPSLLDLIERSRLLRTASGGLYDPAVGGLVRLWGFHTSDYPIRTPPPDAIALERWLDSDPSLEQLVVDGDGTVRTSNPAVQLDFNAIAEGVAAERAAELLQQHGVADALLSLGGDVLALGRAGERPWRVALRDPFGSVLAAVDLSGREALFTSGNYNKYRNDPDGSRRPHLLDPRSARPATGVAAVSVLHPDPVLADAAATALFIAGPDHFPTLAARMHIGCALLLTTNDHLLLLPAMQPRLTLHRQPARTTVVSGIPRCSNDSQ